MGTRDGLSSTDAIAELLVLSKECVWWCSADGTVRVPLPDSATNGDARPADDLCLSRNLRPRKAHTQRDKLAHGQAPQQLPTQAA